MTQTRDRAESSALPYLREPVTSPSARVAVVVGNPRPASRTLDSALHVAQELTGRRPDLVVDLAELGTRLLDWADPEVSRLVADVGDADLVIVASPTYKATYTGLLKLFLDRFAGGTGLSGVAVPLMLGAGLAHALAPELFLRPLLTELGAVVPVRALYVLDSQHDRTEAYDDWLAVARPVLRAVLEGVPS
jgi:FMN reductase